MALRDEPSEEAVRGERPRPSALSALLRELAAPPGAAAAPGCGLRPGMTVGRFELVRELGRGGFGVVFEARDRELGRAVAFKALALGDAPTVREERLLREAEAAARLAHPNIVTLHDVGRSEHGPYLVMELLRGQTLAARLDAGRLPLREAVHVAAEVARGLAHAHREGVVHRDLAPGNVFLCDDGRVKLLDLGLAHAFGRRKVEGGTPGYMAPEARRGAPEDERADVFALGVLIHRMVTGAPPWRGDDEGSRPAPRLPVGAPAALADLVARMLARDPLERPRDGAEVAAALGEVEAALATGSAPPVAAVGTARRARRRPAVVGVATAVAAVAVLGLSLAVARRMEGARAPPSVAVLPFADMSPGHDQEYFSDGLAEEILNALAQVDGLQVTGRTSSFAFKGRSEDLRTIGGKLGVSAVLEGSVRKAGERVRITAQLVHLPDGYHLWSQTFDRDLVDVFAVQDEIARAVVEALRVKLLPGRSAPARERRAPRPEAYTEYLRGRQAATRLTQEGLREAGAAYERAIALDPEFAPSWAALALIRYNACEMGAQDLAARVAGRERALEAAERAVALDPGLAEAFSARAYLRAMVRWDWDGARADIARALALAPNDETTLRRDAILREIVGSAREALAPAARAAELDPLKASNWLVLGSARAGAGDLAGAREAIDRALQIAPSYGWGACARGFVEYLDGRFEAAQGWFARDGEPAARLFGESIVRHALGDRAGSDRALAQLQAGPRGGEVMTLATVHACRGEADEAFRLVEVAFERRESDLVELRKAETCWRNLRGDPRLAGFLRRMKLPPPGPGA